MTTAKRVRFIFYNSHQGKLFSFLQGWFPDEIAVSLTKVKSCLDLPIGRVTKVWLSPRRYPLPETAGAIIGFTLRKTVADFQWLQPFRGLVRSWLLSRARLFYHLFAADFATSRPDLVVLWSGLALPLAAAAAAARNAGIPLLFCENGYLPRTIVMDPAGTNARNSLSGLKRDFYDRVAIHPERLAVLFNNQLVQRPLKKGPDKLQKSLEEKEQQLQLPEAFVFLPLQVFDDSQVLLYSPRFNDMPSLIDYCAAQLEDYNLTHGTDLELVVKEHPSDFGRIRYDRVKAAHPGVTFVQTVGTPELLAKCQAVITINSTVGIEGLFNFKPVITMGEAFYNVTGLVWHVGPETELVKVLAAALNSPVDRDLIEKFLYYLRYEYLVGIDRRNLAEADPRPVVERILSQLH